ncbi:MAG TPA: helix-turn-helix domain-containing protein [Bacteroidia bacterium]|jgi:excisionase family DNA binding protein|nr:helix-turn-helix domain-containing protein [Bacteroidia bacterium]
MKTNVTQKGIRANEVHQMLAEARITKQEAATMLGVSIGTISNYVKSGLLKAIKLGKTKQAKVFFKREDILGLLDFTISTPFDRGFDKIGKGVH